MNQCLAYLNSVWRNSRSSAYRRQVEGLNVNHGLAAKLRNILSIYHKQPDHPVMEAYTKITPPARVKEMAQLQREAFAQSVKVPSVKIPKKEIVSTQKAWKPLQLKLRALKPVVELAESDPEVNTHCLVLLDPEKLQPDAVSETQRTFLQTYDMRPFEVQLDYKNWSLADVMRAVIPSEADSVTSFTQVGHIAHLNLKPEVLPYKSLIGEVIIDKIPSVKTVVNKLNTIDNTYRNFKMELLAGEEKYITQIKEHGCVFELDFSKVYWNSRLATEHYTIVDKIEEGSIIYDLFAGVGPFAVPLAKKKRCKVFANDLNPVSFEFLQKNVTLNKIPPGRVQVYNLDGHDFIRAVIKQDLIDRIVKSGGSQADANEDLKSAQSDIQTECCKMSDSSFPQPTGQNASVPPSYVIMNLPAIAVTFLDSFKLLLQDLPEKYRHTATLDPLLPHVFCYAFASKLNLEKDVMDQLETVFGQALPLNYQTRIVRNVAPNKEMVCISFKLWPNLVLPEFTGDIETKISDSNGLIDKETDAGEDQPGNKRRKLTS